MSQGISVEKEKARQIIRDTKNYLSLLKESGFVALEKGKATQRKISRITTLEALERKAHNCVLCPLARSRTHVVFGEGNPRADLVFVGEAPGEKEDLQARPFVGPAGNYLTALIKKMGLQREDVYICNVIKCRPPANRDPAPEEIATCEPYLVKQLEFINPKIVCALGRHAAQTLLRTKAPISRLRGKMHHYHGVKLFATFHPAAVLHQRSNERIVQEDFDQLKVEYEKAVGRK
jgi:uracil-DNA glycosylase family 4